MKKLRIFISSPGDVQQERQIAKMVIRDLNRIYSRYVELETIMWEDLPLEVTASFQEGIDYFLNEFPVDVAIFILWSRLGSQLGQSFKKVDGTDYQSGTEYEFDMMYSLWEHTHKPKIMVYVKDSEPQFSSRLSLKEIQESLEQKNRLDLFIEDKFRDRETGTNYAYWQFDKQQTFEERLKTHLTRIIRENIGKDVSVREWDGNPYVGLRSYEESESVIFCGRQSLIYDIAEHWMGNADTDIRQPLFILGESGSGKSSLVKAGIIPYLHNMSTDKRKFKVETMTPSEFRGNVYKGLVNKLLCSFPHLEDNPVKNDLIQGLPTDYDFKYLQYALSNISDNDIIVFFFDQFEEIFTDNLISDGEKRKTLQLLKGISGMNRLWLIVSMRNDFYNKFTTFSDLGAIKNMSYLVDIPNVTSTDITDIVEVPAQKANLIWEINHHGLSLSNKLIQEATEIKDLPLIEFGLSELYNNRTEEKLTFDIYEKIGRLKGAIAQYATHCYESLTSLQKAIIGDVFSQIITCSPDDSSLFVRKTALWDDIAKTEDHSLLIRKLVNTYLLKSDKDSDGNSTITIAHEILLTSWPVLTQWIENHRQFIKTNDYYEMRAKHWKDNGSKKDNLLNNEIDVVDGNFFLCNWKENITQTVTSFLKASVKKSRKRWNIILSILDIFFCALLIILLVLSFSDDSPSHYLGESAVGILQITLLIVSIGLNFIYRNWCLSRAKWDKRIFIMWLITFCLSIIDTIFVLINPLPDDSLWVLIVIIILLLIPVVFSFLNYLIVRKWSIGDFEKSHRDNIRYTNIKRSIRWSFLPVIIILLLVYELNDKLTEEEKLNKALEVSTTALSALDATTQSLNPELYQAILNYEADAWDQLSKLFESDTVSLYDYRYADVKNKFGYPDSAITRFWGKSRLDASDLFLQAKINFRLNRLHEVNEYLNKFSVETPDSVADLWQLANWAILTRNPRCKEFYDMALLRNEQIDSLIFQTLNASVELNENPTAYNSFVNRIRNIYEVNDSVVRPFISDYLWYHDMSFLTQSDLQCLLGNDYPELLTLPKDTIVESWIKDILLNNTFYSYDEELDLFLFTDFLPSNRVFRRRFCSRYDDGELNTFYIEINNYRLKEQNNGLYFEHYSLDRHVRKGFIINTITNDSIVLEQRLPISKSGEKRIWYKFDTVAEENDR